MAKTNFQSVDEYLATLPASAQGVLQRVRSIIRNAIPEAEEGISYQIPAYKLGGKTVIFFAGWKQHFSLYPVSQRLLDALGEKAEGCETSKGTIRFPLSQPVPVRLIERIAKHRAQEVLTAKSELH